MHSLSPIEARRLALARAGLLKPEWTGLPRNAAGRGTRGRRAAHAVLERFGYLQLDTVSVAGARSHAIVLLSRFEGMAPELPEKLLQPGEPLFEYWGHEASWIPLELYPYFGFRRRAFAKHPWWGDLVGQNPEVAKRLRSRLREEGPLRSLDMEGKGGTGWWNLKLTKKVATALWSSGELAIRERKAFQRTFDLTERVIPEPWLGRDADLDESLRVLLLRALDGHGWAQTGTLANTWRLRNLRGEIQRALEELREAGEIVPCGVEAEGDAKQGWIRPRDLELAGRLRKVRPARDRGVLLSPFDPVLWDRPRVRLLFDFDQILEIFKPAPTRQYGYYCLPVLAGDRLVARFDLKAHRNQGRLEILAAHFEEPSPSAADRAAAHTALMRYSHSLELSLPEETRSPSWRS